MKNVKFWTFIVHNVEFLWNFVLFYFNLINRLQNLLPVTIIRINRLTGYQLPWGVLWFNNPALTKPDFFLIEEEKANFGKVKVKVLSGLFVICRCNGNSHRLNLKLPVMFSKFSEPAEMDSATFFARWKGLSQWVKECSK